MSCILSRKWKGKLSAERTPYDLIRATFPAGTLSGAPKIRAMQIIAELEQTARGPYGGCVGYFSFNGNLDCCITIRTALIKDGTGLRAGGRRLGQRLHARGGISGNCQQGQSDAQSRGHGRKLSERLKAEGRILGQDGLLGFQKFLNGFYVVAGIGNADGVGLAQFVMHQQFADHAHLQMSFRHAPDLTGGQGWLAASEAGRLSLFHGSFCALTFNLAT